MKRSKVRKILLIISFLLFPVTLFYFSPYLIIEAFAVGIISGCAIVFFTQFISGIFFGRAFCSYICPASGLQDFCSMAVNNNVKNGWRNFIKYIVWAVWMAIIVVIIVKADKPLIFDFFYKTESGVSIASLGNYIIYYGVVSLITIMALTIGKRAFCHYLCWMAPFIVLGQKLRRALRLPGLHLEADAEICIHCNKCTKTCPMSLEVEEMVNQDKMSNSECILCGECIDACPKDLIKYEFGREKYGKKE